MTQLFDGRRQLRSHQNKLSLDQGRCDGEGSNAESLLISLLRILISPDNQASVPEERLLGIMEYSWLEAEGAHLCFCVSDRLPQCFMIRLFGLRASCIRVDGCVKVQINRTGEKVWHEERLEETRRKFPVRRHLNRHLKRRLKKEIAETLD